MVFLREVGRQSAFALIAFSDLNAALASMRAAARSPVDARANTNRVWYCVQNALIAVGNVSKLLWPAKKYEVRGDALRKQLGVPEDSVLAPRSFRNHFEHFDERVEEWAASTGGRNFVDSNIGPAGMIAGLDENQFLRNLDTSNMAVTFQGEAYPLQTIATAIKEIHERAEKLVNQALNPPGLGPAD